jgi:hypothetical protein
MVSSLIEILLYQNELAAIIEIIDNWRIVFSMIEILNSHNKVFATTVGIPLQYSTCKLQSIEHSIDSGN